MFSSSFFDAELVGGAYDRVYAASNFAEYFASFIANGVFPNPATNLQIVANTTPNMTVLASAGLGWINGYYCKNSNPYPMAIAAASGSQARIDSIMLRWDKAARNITTYVKMGTPSANPQPPTVERTPDVYELMLATVLVGAGVTKIVQGNITDKRADTSVCGYVHGVVDQIDTTDLFAQYDEAFQTWFADIQSQLSGDIATNLQNQINKLKTDKVEVLDKATTSEAQQAGTDSKWMTPSKTKALVDYRLPTQAVAEAGQDNAKLMTPLRVKQVIDKSGVQVVDPTGSRFILGEVNKSKLYGASAVLTLSPRLNYWGDFAITDSYLVRLTSYYTSSGPYVYVYDKTTFQLLYTKSINFTVIAPTNRTPKILYASDTAIVVAPIWDGTDGSEIFTGTMADNTALRYIGHSYAYTMWFEGSTNLIGGWVKGSTQTQSINYVSISKSTGAIIKSGQTSVQSANQYSKALIVGGNNKYLYICHGNPSGNLVTEQLDCTTGTMGQLQITPGDGKSHRVFLVYSGKAQAIYGGAYEGDYKTHSLCKLNISDTSASVSILFQGDGHAAWPYMPSNYNTYCGSDKDNNFYVVTRQDPYKICKVSPAGTLINETTLVNGLYGATPIVPEMYREFQLFEENKAITSGGLYSVADGTIATLYLDTTSLSPQVTNRYFSALPNSLLLAGNLNSAVGIFEESTIEYDIPNRVRGVVL